MRSRTSSRGVRNHPGQGPGWVLEGGSGIPDRGSRDGYPGIPGPWIPGSGTPGTGYPGTPGIPGILGSWKPGISGTPGIPLKRGKKATFHPKPGKSSKFYFGVFSRFLRKPGVFQDPSRVSHSGRVVLGFPGKSEIRIPGSIEFYRKLWRIYPGRIRKKGRAPTIFSRPLAIYLWSVVGVYGATANSSRAVCNYYTLPLLLPYIQ